MRKTVAGLLLLVACGGEAEPVAPAPPGETATIVLGGDTMLARGVAETILADGPRHVWGDVLPLLAEGDLALVNLECVVAEGGRPFEPRRVFYFRAPPAAADALHAAGVDCVSLANNHAMDYGGEALLECLGRLDAAGIAHAGAGRGLADAARPAIVPAGGIRVGVVAFADHFREYRATLAGPGTNVIEVPAGLGEVHRAIRAAHAAGADLVVVSAHWGPNMRQAPPPAFREFARAVIDAGADVFHGHSAHVFQGIEIHRGRPILYDTGDLVDDYRVDPEKRNDLALLFRLVADREAVRRIELVPLRIADRQVNRARGGDFDEVARRITRLSAEMGTTIAREGDLLVVRSP